MNATNNAITVRQCLLNGHDNLTNGLAELGWEQVSNAIDAIRHGMELDDVIQLDLDAPIRLNSNDPL